MVFVVAAAGGKETEEVREDEFELGLWGAWQVSNNERDGWRGIRAPWSHQLEGQGRGNEKEQEK